MKRKSEKNLLNLVDELKGRGSKFFKYRNINFREKFAKENSATEPIKPEILQPKFESHLGGSGLPPSELSENLEQKALKTLEPSKDKIPQSADQRDNQSQVGELILPRPVSTIPSIKLDVYLRDEAKKLNAELLNETKSEQDALKNFVNSLLKEETISFDNENGSTQISISPFQKCFLNENSKLPDTSYNLFILLGFDTNCFKSIVIAFLRLCSVKTKKEILGIFIPYFELLDKFFKAHAKLGYSLVDFDNFRILEENFADLLLVEKSFRSCKLVLDYPNTLPRTFIDSDSPTDHLFHIANMGDLVNKFNNQLIHFEVFKSNFNLKNNYDASSLVFIKLYYLYLHSHKLDPEIHDFHTKRIEGEFFLTLSVRSYWNVSYLTHFDVLKQSRKMVSLLREIPRNPICLI